ncbi:glutamate receptor 2.7 [Rosa sericea]
MLLKNPSHQLKVALSIFFFLSSSLYLATPENKTIIRVNVGIILDDYKHSLTGKIWLSSIKMALTDFYASHALHNTKLVLNIRNSKGNVVRAANAAQHLMKHEQVQAIIGPVTSTETNFVINLGDQTHVPILSFSATSPSLTSLRSSYFFQFAQNDTSQVEAISAVVKAFGWREVVPIYLDTSYGQGIIPALTNALQEVGAFIPYRSVISPFASDDQIKEELYKLMTMQTRVFIVHMTTNDLICSKLFTKANEIGMMKEGYVWLTANGIANSLQLLNSSVIHSMHGVLGVETHVQQTPELEGLKIRWKKQFQKDNPTIIFGVELDVFGLWAYDAAFALAMAIEKVYGLTASHNNTDYKSFHVSQYGPKLRKALSTTRFQGMAGDFRLVDGQLQSSKFQIINVNGGGSRTIGFWSPEYGLWNRVYPANSKPNLGPVIWPGDSTSVPKGWEIPTNGKTLKIGVPKKYGYLEFVKVTKDPRTNITDVTGFCIDVFKAVVEILPYALPYEFIPFTKQDGTSAGSYNDLCYEVYRGNLDAVVGDFTILANRSLYVDYTMPYTEAGLVMVVPVVDMTSRRSWDFLKPWKWDLWLTTSCFFLFIGFVVWVLEHRINKHFRGPLAHQIGHGLWFSFSTMVFAQTARVISNLARLVMTIWIFVVLVLTINYTAILTSIYTVQQLQPTVTDLKDLLSKGDNVGCKPNAYTYDILKQFGFNDANLKVFRTMEELDEALSKGTAKGGIAAAIDETPYMKLFLAKYCNKYTMIGPIFKTDGFAFVFPKRSSLLPDVSQAILNVTGGEKIMNIEHEWFKKESNCQDLSVPKVSSNSLGADSFWVLFLIAGVVSLFALIVFVVLFTYKYRDIWNSEASIRSSIGAMLKIFNEKDPSYFNSDQRPEAAETSVYNNSNHTDEHSLFSGEQQVLSIEGSQEAGPEVRFTTEIEMTTPYTAH